MYVYDGWMWYVRFRVKWSVLLENVLVLMDVR